MSQFRLLICKPWRTRLRLCKLPFLVNLTVDERKSMAKLGPNSLSFVQNALTAVLGKPDVFPASFDVQGFQRDFG
jgi:hypothetical protein